jgi:hypothetical protein
MNPLEALETLDAALQTLNANRQTHAHLIKCVQTVRAALLPPKPEAQADGNSA